MSPAFREAEGSMYSLGGAIDALRLQVLSFVGWLNWCTPNLLFFWTSNSLPDCPTNAASWPVLGTERDASLRQIAETQWSKVGIGCIS